MGISLLPQHGRPPNWKGASSNGWIGHGMFSFEKKISIYTWKVLNHILLLDDRTRMLGIPIVSSYNCCTNRKEKTLDHIMSTSKVATPMFGNKHQPWWVVIMWKTIVGEWKSPVGSEWQGRQPSLVRLLAYYWLLLTWNCGYTGAKLTWRRSKNKVM